MKQGTLPLYTDSAIEETESSLVVKNSDVSNFQKDQITAVALRAPQIHINPFNSLEMYLKYHIIQHKFAEDINIAKFPTKTDLENEVNKIDVVEVSNFYGDDLLYVLRQYVIDNAPFITDDDFEYINRLGFDTNSFRKLAKDKIEFNQNMFELFHKKQSEGSNFEYLQLIR